MRQRYTIAYKGVGAGTHRFEFQVGNDFWNGREESGIKGGDVRVEATLVKAEGAGGATGSVARSGARGGSGVGGVMRLEVAMEGNVVVPCDRCLEDCELPVDFHGELAVRFSEEEHPFEGDILWLNPADGVIDLEQYIYESIVLSLPLQRVHPEDVHGQPLCNPAMLSRFKIVSEEEWENLQKQ